MSLASSRPPYTLLIVGNGLTIDLCRNYAADELGSWNTSCPLCWPVMTPGEPGVLLRDRLPVFDAAVRDLQTAELNDFEVIDRIAHRYFSNLADHSRERDDPEGDYEIARAYVEARHYLALAYSTFQVEVDRLDLTGWRWAQYFQSLGRDLIGAFSFNYDLVLERALDTAGIPYGRLGLPEEDEGHRHMIVKPHGSIDFDVQHAVFGGELRYPIRNLLDRVNSKIQRVPRDDLLCVRADPELIAPMQASTARDYQWVAPGFDGFASTGAWLTGTCVLAGLSYWDVDRPEIDEVLDMLLPNTEIIVANPKPPPELLEAIRARGFEPVEREGPPF